MLFQNKVQRQIRESINETIARREADSSWTISEQVSPGDSYQKLKLIE